MPATQEGRGQRETVLLGSAVPDWIITRLGDFDLRMADESCDMCRSARAVIAGSAQIDDAFLDRFPAIEYVTSVGSGYENIDIAAARRRGIIVTCGASGPAEDVADHTIGLILTLGHRIIANDHAIRMNEWPKHPQFRRSLSETNVGIFGLGMIGKAVARRLEPFGCTIRWTGPHHRETPYGYMPDVLALAEWADILVVTARADASNAGLIGEAVLGALGPSGLLVNVSRGSIVDEGSLIQMLHDGRIGGAALDVFQSEPTLGERWRDVPNTVLTPHMAGYGSRTRHRIQEILAANLAAFFHGQPLSGRIV